MASRTAKWGPTLVQIDIAIKECTDFDQGSGDHFQWPSNRFKASGILRRWYELNNFRKILQNPNHVHKSPHIGTSINDD
jgi:hypothetical protein